MLASVIDGKAIALEIQGEVAEQIKSRVAAGLRPPGLATILVGDDGESTSATNAGRATPQASGHLIMISPGIRPNRRCSKSSMN